ncbi:MAG TPA: GNAT family N-acetyltransferase [Chloroflexota bacterium]
MSGSSSRCTETVRARQSAGVSGREDTVDVELELDGRVVSSCRIVPLRLRVGAATIRVDGIGQVETLEGYRHRGFARRVLNVALHRMEDGDADLSMLYGITGFYPQFGYIAVGPETTISLSLGFPGTDLPSGMSVRPFRIDDLQDVQRLYERAAAHVIGAAVRSGEGYPWTSLLHSVQGGDSQDCRVVTDSGGQIVAYAWRGEHLPFVRAHAERNPDHFILAEVAADGSRSADAALACCRQWAIHEGERRRQEVKGILLFLPHVGPVAAAAMHMPATFCRSYGPDGGWMGRVLSARRLFVSLRSEIFLRLREAHHLFTGRLHVVTEEEDLSLLIARDGMTIEGGASQASCMDPTSPTVETLVKLPQATLARLVMGSYPPHDLLSCLADPLDARTIDLLETMFPHRPSQIFLADRF